jgi:hypothetical protein
MGKPELMALLARFGYTPEKIQNEFHVYTRLADLILSYIQKGF